MTASISHVSLVRDFHRSLELKSVEGFYFGSKEVLVEYLPDTTTNGSPSELLLQSRAKIKHAFLLKTVWEVYLNIEIKQ